MPSTKCPECHKRSEVSLADLQSFMSCPDCGAVFHPLTGELANTVDYHTEDGEGDGVEQVAPPESTPEFDEVDFSNDPAPNMSIRTGLLAFALVLPGAVMLLAVIIFVAGRGPEQSPQEVVNSELQQTGKGLGGFVSRPVRDTNYVAWTHKELLDHLNGAGVVTATDGTNFGSKYGPAMYFGRGTIPPRFVLDRVPVDSSHFKDVAYVQIRSSPQEARDQAGTLGEHAFAWHRFLFCGDPAFLAQLRKALP